MALSVNDDLWKSKVSNPNLGESIAPCQSWYDWIGFQVIDRETLTLLDCSRNYHIPRAIDWIDSMIQGMLGVKSRRRDYSQPTRSSTSLPAVTTNRGRIAERGEGTKKERRRSAQQTNLGR
jgi:hypothetical protein